MHTYDFRVSTLTLRVVSRFLALTLLQQECSGKEGVWGSDTEYAPGAPYTM